MLRAVPNNWVHLLPHLSSPPGWTEYALRATLLNLIGRRCWSSDDMSRVKLEVTMYVPCLYEQTLN